MKPVIFLLLCFTVHASSAQISGNYLWYSAAGYASKTICLNKNGTFKFDDHVHMASWNCSGKYYKSGDTLILNSDLQTQDILKARLSRSNQSDSITINFTLASEDSFIIYNLIINDTSKYPDLLSNTVKLPRISVNSFSIQFEQPSWWLIPNRFLPTADTNVFDIWIDDTRGFNYLFLKNEKFLVKDHQLIPLESGKQDLIFQLRPKTKCE